VPIDFRRVVVAQALLPVRVLQLLLRRKRSIQFSKPDSQEWLSYSRQRRNHAESQGFH
jgi:hypothetical protein